MQETRDIYELPVYIVLSLGAGLLLKTQRRLKMTSRHCLAPSQRSEVKTLVDVARMLGLWHFGQDYEHNTQTLLRKHLTVITT